MRYIYITTNLINGNRYLGQRKLPKNKTINNDDYLGSGNLILKAIRKYGKDNFSKEIIHVCESQKEADLLEIKEIKEREVLENKDKWYNRDAGGQFKRLENHVEIMECRMKDYYSDDKNYTNYQLKINRIRYKKGLSPTKYTTIADRDIYRLRKNIQRNISKESKKQMNKIKALIKRFRGLPTEQDMKRMYITAMSIKKNSIKNKRTSYWSDDNKKTFALAKLRASNNMLGVYIVTHYDIDYNTIAKKISKTINTKYKDSNNLIKQLDSIRKIILSNGIECIDLKEMIDITIVSRANRGL